MGNSCNYDLLHARGGEDLALKIYFGRVSVITVISSYLEFKGYSAVHDWTVCYRSWFVGHKSATGSTDSTQTPHYIDHVYLDRLFLLSNLTWRRTPRGYSIYLWVGRCGAAPHTLTLFKTNIADFPTLFKIEFRLFNTLFKTFNPNIN